MKNHPLVEAARYGDAQAEEHGLIEALTSGGINPEIIQHVAQQRSLRLVILTNRGPEAMLEMTSGNETKEVHLTRNESEQMSQLVLAYLDGIYIGWLGADIASRSKTE